MLAALLKPLGICATYLNAKVLPVRFLNCYDSISIKICSIEVFIH